MDVSGKFVDLKASIDARAEAAHKAQLEPQSAAKDPNLLHWASLGKFEVEVVGESFYREALASVAQNLDGKATAVYCTATLKPEPNNEFDEHAVSVWINACKVGHLSSAYNQYFLELLPDNLKALLTTCDAFISGGATFDNDVGQYGVKLDLPRVGTGKLGKLVPTYPTPQRKVSKCEFTQLGDGVYKTTVIMPPIQDNYLHKYRRVGSWTRDDWSTINYYVDNQMGAGLGHIAFKVPKNLHTSMFGNKYPEVFVETIKGNQWTFLMTLHANSEERAEYQNKWKTASERAFEKHVKEMLAKPEIDVVFAMLDDTKQTFHIDRYLVSLPKGLVEKKFKKKIVDATALNSILQEVDLIVAINPQLYISSLASVFPNAEDFLRHKWRNPKLLWSESKGQMVSELISARECKTSVNLQGFITDLLFQHSGKTTRSKTHLAHLLRIPLKAQ
jgi:hypothetical protein